MRQEEIPSRNNYAHIGLIDHMIDDGLKFTKFSIRNFEERNAKIWTI